MMKSGVVLIAMCAAGWSAPGDLEYNRDVRPILSDRCFSCHGPDSVNRKAGLRLDQEAAAKAELRKKFAIVPGDPAASEVFRRITSDNKALRMPPAYAGHDKLSDAQIDVIRRWIEQGAKWQAHWSFLAPQRPTVPALVARSPVRNPIDAFILSRLERENLSPSPEASKQTLIRRVTLDLTGLPPTPAEVEAFVQDPAEDAYQKVVRRLLASPRYAERMAIRWLEAARYSDTNGYQSDGVRDMWRWRDWVIDAFRRNMPFDQFTVEQLAGDLLPNPTLSQRIATGFHRNHRTTAEGGIIDEEFRVEYVADRVETTSTVWLGLTLNCTRCHDHKYDPILQKDFYRLFAFFNNVPEKGFVYNFGNEPPFIKAPTEEQQQKLAALDSTAGEARSRWEALGPKLEAEQTQWEKSIVRTPDLDWSPIEDRQVSGPLENPRFDGTRVVDLGTDAAKFNHRDPLTLAVWVKPETTKGAILTRTEDYWEGTGYGLYVIDGKLRFHFVYRWTDLGMRMETTKPLKQGEWQHIAVTYDGNMLAKGVHIYIDGQEQEKNVLFDQHLWPIDHKAPLRIGGGAGLSFQGEIDRPLVYGRVLSPREIAVIQLREPLGKIAAIPSAQRTPAQADKLRFAFVEKYVPKELAEARRKMRLAQRERDAFYETIPTVMVMQEGPPRDTFVLKRGAYDAHGEKVTAGVPASLPPLKADWPVNRLGLARWLVDRSHPLTARVTVNRFWQMLFGTGIVKTVEDFGLQGEWPVHPELLDWLAVEFMESGWDVKRLIETIVTSATYRQASKVTPDLLQKDPENRLLARGPRFRLSHEMLRDQALAASGLLVEKVGGASVKPYQPAGLWQELTGGSGYKADRGDGLYRRSLYTYWRRTIAPPSMITFDSPTRENCIVRESRTNTPLQALNLMNDVTYLEAARKLAGRMLAEGGAAEADRIRHGFRLVVSREPSARELAVLAKALAKFRNEYDSNPGAAKTFLQHGESPLDKKADPVQLAGYTGVASLILNLDEAVTKE